MPAKGLRAIDVYFEARLAFFDLPDVRLRTYEEPQWRMLVVEARSPRAVVSWTIDEGFMVDAPAWAARDGAGRLRREFDYHEQWAETRALDKIRETRSVR